LSHPNVKLDKKRCLLDASWSADRERYIWKIENKSFRFYLLHRLDSATSGVIVGCVNPNLVRDLKGQFSKRRVAKSYTAIVAGAAKESDDEWTDYLQKKRMANRLRVTAQSSGRGMKAETRIKIQRVKRTNPKLSLLKLYPMTGRTHQLRVQCAKRKLPIIGDSTYGDFSLNRSIQKSIKSQRMFLHASSIRLRWQGHDSEEKFHAKAPLPDLFATLLDLELS